MKRKFLIWAIIRKVFRVNVIDYKFIAILFKTQKCRDSCFKPRDRLFKPRN